MKQPGELIQKLMQNSSILPTSTVTSQPTTTTVTNETAFDPIAQISISNQNQHELCLDEFLKDDTYDKLMKNSENADHLIPELADNTFNDTSNMLAFNNLTINSSYGLNSLSNNNNFHMNFPPTLETINEDSIKELLGALR